MAQSTIASEAKIVLNSNSQVSTPAAIAFRSSKSITKVIRPEDVFKYPIRFGQQALPLLKKNSSIGLRYINKVIGRYTQTEFHTCQLANVTELSSVSLYDYISKHSHSEGLVFVIPQFWTNEQRVAIQSACNMANLDILTIVDDFTSISLLYGSLRNNKYRKKPKHVLFIDVGSTSTKVYGAKFSWSDDKSNVQQTSAVWTEKCGGYYLAKALSQSLNISFNKATKKLSQSHNTDLLPHISDVLDEFRKTIQEAMNLSIQAAGPFDEIQVTGGASQYKFIVDVILTTANASYIQRDFNANEAFALGGVIAGLQMAEMNVYSPVYVKRLPMFDIEVECGDRVRYCTKNEKCEEVVITNSTCSTVKMYAPQHEVPEGTLNIVAEYEMVNISNIKEGNNIHGFFQMTPPDALIESATFCTSPNEVQCKPISMYPYNRRKMDNDYSKKWADSYIQLVKSKERKAKLLAKVDDQLKKLGSLLIPGPNVNQENVFPIDDNVREVFMERYNDFKAGKMHNWDEGEINGALEDLEEVFKCITSQLM